VDGGLREGRAGEPSTAPCPARPGWPPHPRRPQWNRGGGGGGGGGGAPDQGARGGAPRGSKKAEALLSYVAEVKPAVMEEFTRDGSPEVVDAMRQTITNMLGTLPPQFFDVSISARGENMAQLMYSVLMTGYMFRNAGEWLSPRG